MPDARLERLVTSPKGLRLYYQDPETKEVSIQVKPEITQGAPKLSYNPFKALQK